MNIQALQELTVIVTDDHFNRGKARNCGECPIALSVAEATGCTEDGAIMVDYEQLTVFADSGQFVSDMPSLGRHFQKSFDEGTGLAETMVPLTLRFTRFEE